MQVNLGQKKKVKEIEGVRADLSDDEFDELLNTLEGQKINEEEWEIVDEQDYVEDYDDWADTFIMPKEKKEFADEISAKPDGFSYLDKSYYKIRFKYFKKSKRRTKTGQSRTFCKNMMRLSAQGTVYRLEDIDAASRAGVNRQLGHKGRPYDLFRFKGGIWCTHAFKIILYRLKSGSELREGQGLDDYKKTSSIPKSYEPNPRGIKDAVQAANASNNWWKYPGAKN